MNLLLLATRTIVEDKDDTDEAAHRLRNEGRDVLLFAQQKGSQARGQQQRDNHGSRPEKPLAPLDSANVHTGLGWHGVFSYVPSRPAALARCWSCILTSRESSRSSADAKLKPP